MKFRSRDGEPKRIALTDGRIAVITEEWRDLPDDMAPAAYGLGCISEDMVGIAGPEDEAKKRAPVELTVETVKAAIKTMLERNQDGDFTKVGLPDKTALNKMCGGKVDADIFDQAWDELQADGKE